jgi:SAM-dependent methyltransferase
MDVSSLPFPGIIRNWLELDCLPKLGVDVRDKDVLAIGYSREQLAAAIETHHPRSITILTKWPDHMDAHMGDLKVTIGDICSSDVFDAHQFDIVTTLSVLEHVDLPEAFANIHRILRPGGIFVSVFGPVWSGPYGHHLYVDPEDPLLNFSLWKSPGWMHLLSSPTEIMEFYRKNGYSDETINHIIDKIYQDDSINRTMYEDYIDQINPYFTIINTHILYNTCSQDTYQKLRKKFPRYFDFSTYGGAWVAVRRD